MVILWLWHYYCDNGRQARALICFTNCNSVFPFFSLPLAPDWRAVLCGHWCSLSFEHDIFVRALIGRRWARIVCALTLTVSVLSIALSGCCNSWTEFYDKMWPGVIMTIELSSERMCFMCNMKWELPWSTHANVRCSRAMNRTLFVRGHILVQSLLQIVIWSNMAQALLVVRNQ